MSPSAPDGATIRIFADALPARIEAMASELEARRLAQDVALAVHGGSRVHTFTAFTCDANTLRDQAAGVACWRACAR